MKNKQFTAILIIALTMSLFSGCRRYEAPNYITPTSDIEFDQKEMNITVAPETKLIEINFHSNGIIPTENQIIPFYQHLFVDNSSSAKIYKHFTISGIDEAGMFEVTYNLSATTGNFIIQLNPENITETVELVITRFPNLPEHRTTIKLIPSN